MSKFWQKKYISKYSGAEIDAAVAKADTVPAVTAADAGKTLVVDETGKIVAGEGGAVSYVQFPDFPMDVATALLLFVGSTTTSYKSNVFDLSDIHDDLLSAFSGVSVGDIVSVGYSEESTLSATIGILTQKGEDGFVFKSSFLVENSGVLINVYYSLVVNESGASFTVGSIASTLVT